LRANGDLDGAIAEYRKAIELDPMYAEANINLVHALQAKGDPEGTIAEYRKAIEHDRKNGSVRSRLAWLLATDADTSRRDPRMAVALVQQAVELEPRNGAYWQTLGVAQYRDGDWKGTVEALEKSMDLRKGGDAFDWFFLAMARWQLDQKDVARKWYDKAVEW